MRIGIGRILLAVCILAMFALPGCGKEKEPVESPEVAVDKTWTGNSDETWTEDGSVSGDMKNVQDDRGESAEAGNDKTGNDRTGNDKNKSDKNESDKAGSATDSNAVVENEDAEGGTADGIAIVDDEDVFH